AVQRGERRVAQLSLFVVLAVTRDDRGDHELAEHVTAAADRGRADVAARRARIDDRVDLERGDVGANELDDHKPVFRPARGFSAYCFSRVSTASMASADTLGGTAICTR